MKHPLSLFFCTGILLLALLAGCATPQTGYTPTPIKATPTYTVTPLPRLRGLAYSPYRDCQSPDTDEQPTVENIRRDLQIIKDMANGIRTYSTTGISAEIPALARQMGLSVSAGVWLGKDKEANEREIQGLIDISNEVDLESAIVGNEVLLRGDLTEDELLGYIERVKSAVNIPVTTAEIGSILLSHPAVMDAVDYEMVHLYPFWEGATIDGAAQNVIDEYDAILEKSNGKRVVIGETGWPSSGPANGASIPSLENQRQFAREFLSLAQEEGIDFYYFAAFDEMWKAEGGIGPYWGLLFADRTFKTDVQGVMASFDVTPRASTSEGHVSVPTVAATQQGEKSTPEDFYIYSNFGDASNHFAPDGWMGDLSTIGLNTCWMEGQPWPKSMIQVSYAPDQKDDKKWADIYWLQPKNNWGVIPNAGYDLTKYQQLVFQARAEETGTQIKFFVGGVSKDDSGSPLPYPSSIPAPIFAQEADPVDGFVNLTDSWQEYHIDLTGVDLHNVIDGFGWAAEQARTPNGTIFYLDDIHFVSNSPALPIVPPIHIYYGTSLRDGLDMGMDLSLRIPNWVQNMDGYMKVNYPELQTWGVVFITVGQPAPHGVRASMDLRQYKTLSVEMRGETGVEQVYIGLKDASQVDTGRETKILQQLGDQWQTYTFDLQDFTGVDLSRIYIPIEFVFQGNIGAETIYFRHIQVLP
jgi:glucan 1,3-beta-glucosidase